MKAKEYLRHLQRLDTMINQKIKELNDLRMISQSTGGMDYSKERVQSIPTGDAPFVQSVLRIAELEKEINAEIDRFVDEKHTIIKQIQALQNPRYIDILYKRYIEYKSLEQICVEMKFSYDHIRHLHGDALKEFGEKFLKSTHNNTL